MLKFGIISDVDPARGLVRVNFNDESDFVSNWIPCSMPKTLEDEFFVIPEVNTHVWAIMDDLCENGVVGGCIFDSQNKPSDGSLDKTYIKFKDGTSIVYDRAAHIMTVTNGTVIHEISRAGFKIKKGSETLNKILDDLFTQLAALTVTCAGPGNPSGPPINLAALNAIKARLITLFTE